VQASEKMAATDLTAMNTYRQKIMDVASELDVDPAIIAGLAKI